MHKRHVDEGSLLGGQPRSRVPSPRGLAPPGGGEFPPAMMHHHPAPTIVTVKSHSHLQGQSGGVGVGGGGGGLGVGIGAGVIGGSGGSGGTCGGIGGGGCGGGRLMFSSSMALLMRLGPLFIALASLFMWRSTRAELAAMTATMSARVAEVEASLRSSQGDLRLERERVAAVRHAEGAEKKAAVRRAVECEATTVELRAELDAVEKMKTIAERESAASAAEAAHATAAAQATHAGGGDTDDAATVVDSEKILAARDALLSLGQALYSNAPATFLPRQGSLAAEEAAAARDDATLMTCPGLSEAAVRGAAAAGGGGGGGGGGGEKDEHDVSPLVRKDYVFRNPGRPEDGSTSGGVRTGASGGGGSGSGAGIDYSHMAMISRLPRAALWRWILVWQAANVKEGEPDQHFLCAFSDDAIVWTPPVAMPLGKQRGAIPWSPVLHLSPDGDNLVIFFAESTTCRRPGSAPGWPQRWAPGGDIRLATSRDGFRWSKRVAVLSQQIGGNVPKVIANPAVTLRSGAMLLPYWEEVPHLSEEVAGCPLPGSEPNAGALVSTDGGRTWEPSAGLADDDTWLIEGTAAELHDGRVLHLFRTSVGTIYRSVSSDGGNTWSKAVSSGLPNPNSKFHLMRLSDGTLALAYNHHNRARTNLYVALSKDGGDSWHLAARVESQDGGKTPGEEEKENRGLMAAYPTMYQDGCRLLVTYSIMERRAWLEVQDRAALRQNAGGIKIAEVDLSAVKMTDANLINTGQDAVERPLVSMAKVVEEEEEEEEENGAATQELAAEGI